MKVLITGNLGYIGPVLVDYLSKKQEHWKLVGLDIGYFAHVITSNDPISDVMLAQQIYKDVRDLKMEDFDCIDSVVYLAAISNDPMGNKFEKATIEINQNSAINCANLARTAGVKSFVFASSCSVYGTAEEGFKNEQSAVNPLTAYAKSKINSENELKKISTDSFKVTCLRFATACGFSPRLRLDLVLNDFVASALVNNEIEILSDGSPWRPLIHVRDMSKAIEWAIDRDIKESGNFLALNVGSNQWNYKIKDLANAVLQVIPGVVLKINENAQPDKRSYRVDFSLYESLNPSHNKFVGINDAVNDLVNGLNSIGFNDKNFRSGKLIRLNVLNKTLN
jgi:nucleoside-diphosphate-sugar epimerase